MLDECPTEVDQAAQVMSAFEPKPAEAEGPGWLLPDRRRGLRPDFNLMSIARGSPRHFFGKGRDSAPVRVEFMRENVEGRSAHERADGKRAKRPVVKLNQWSGLASVWTRKLLILIGQGTRPVPAGPCE